MIVRFKRCCTDRRGQNILGLTEKRNLSFKYTSFQIHGAPQNHFRRYQCNNSPNLYASVHVHTPKQGGLTKGQLFLVYRFLPYCGNLDLRSQIFPGGSFRCCYLLPFEFPFVWRRTASFIRKISFAPPGASTNEVLDSLFSDITINTVEGFDWYHAAAIKCSLFLHLCGLVGDYPVSPEVIVGVKHMADASWRHCFFIWK